MLARSEAVWSLVVSSHNPRSILVRPVWNREHVRRLADTMGKQGHIIGDETLFC